MIKQRILFLMSNWKLVWNLKWFILLIETDCNYLQLLAVAPLSVHTEPRACRMYAARMYTYSAESRARRTRKHGRACFRLWRRARGEGVTERVTVLFLVPQPARAACDGRIAAANVHKCCEWAES